MSYPQAHQFSVYTAGGSGPAIFTQVQNYLCRMQRTDPGAAAEITTYFIEHGSGCTREPAEFRDEVNAFKDAVGNFPALIFVEEDAIDTICWRNPAAVSGSASAAEVRDRHALAACPTRCLYVEGGTSDANSPAEAARVLNASDAYKIRGFFTNDTHFNWAYKEIQYGNKVAKLTHGLHFVIDTRGDGNGPMKNRAPGHPGQRGSCATRPAAASVRSRARATGSPTGCARPTSTATCGSRRRARAPHRRARGVRQHYAALGNLRREHRDRLRLARERSDRSVAAVPEPPLVTRGGPAGKDARRNGPRDAGEAGPSSRQCAARACFGSQNTAAHAAARNADRQQQRLS